MFPMSYAGTTVVPFEQVHHDGGLHKGQRRYAGKEVKGMHLVGALEELVAHHHLERGQEGSDRRVDQPVPNQSIM
jgi:hypothetical protein